MPATIEPHKTRQEWLSCRNRGIGASEISVILGESTYKTEQDLWMEKTGRKSPDDLSDNPQVQYGTEAEALLRALFLLKHKTLRMVYRPYDVYVSEKKPFMRATLDGELIQTDGTHGVWECKTALIQSKAALEDWNGRIPQKYYLQILHQLYVTEFDFAILNAELRFPDNNSEIREYTINAANVADDMDYVSEEAERFWKFVEEDRKPPMKLRL